jgi:hypothetical protein
MEHHSNFFQIPDSDSSELRKHPASMDVASKLGHAKIRLMRFSNCECRELFSLLHKQLPVQPLTP